MIVLEEVDGLLAHEVSLGSQSYGIAKEWEVKVGAEVQIQHTRVSTSNTYLCASLEMERMALRLRQQATYCKVILCGSFHVVSGGSTLKSRHLVVAVLV